ncbi:MAG: 1-deoxy-D-xylulose-5-phosphate reductoisomerase [Deltaproteobacteria bacterium]|jgi:1-deoxy-D-xylulose-5-phosphate reductoisomerase|nr:1-deoxy-D-xylulose-5-phosphate reductoisomerase [Deltaproteobacteria bacterium]
MISYITPLPDTAPPFPRRVAVMGSTGSIGLSTLSVLEASRENFGVAALAAARNARLLAEQAAVWRPGHLAVLDDAVRRELTALLAPLRKEGYRPQIHTGPEGYALLASLPEADVVVSAQAGAAGLAATYAAAGAGKVIALANKESLVLAGELLRETARRAKALILPVDSEHNAIFQCLAGQETAGVSRLILTASGGPFRGKDAAFLKTATPAMALAHPNWSMGAKITIDSATLMNKGLEVIEAFHLYGLPLEAIEVLVHPQSVVHSLVEFTDSSLLAQAGPPDMRIALSHCLGWPRRIHNRVPPLDLASLVPLTFEKPDLALFPCLDLAREALKAGGGLPVALNAANEIAVDAFLSKRISFIDIARIVEKGMDRCRALALQAAPPSTLEEIMELDGAARRKTAELLP